MQFLLQRPGFVVTRYRADSVTLFAQEKRILLVGDARTEREGSTLEAQEIDYLDAGGLLEARGSPMLFSEGNVLVGKDIRYYTTDKRGVVTGALTSFDQGGTEWFLRGSIAEDSSSHRIYAHSSEITSCDLPDPHYHFSAGEVKWIHGQVMVARPAVLYVRDVPVLWLPFVFQDGRPDRHSGILVPRIGISDIVRPTPSFKRQISNIGYYWAASDYFDLTTRFDWLDQRYTTLGLYGQYRWLDRFTTGSIGLSRQWASGGGRSTGILWDHHQIFSLSSSLNLSLNYVTNSSVVTKNAVDPLITTQQITSALNYTHRYIWGTLTLGGNLPAEPPEQQLHHPASRRDPQPQAGGHRRQRDLVTRALIHDGVGQQRADCGPDCRAAWWRGGYPFAERGFALDDVQPRDTVPILELQLAERGPGDRLQGQRPVRGLHLGARSR